LLLFECLFADEEEDDEEEEEDTMQAFSAARLEG